MKSTGVFMRSSAIRLGLPVVVGVFVLLTGGRLAFSLREYLRLTDDLAQANQAVAVQEVLYPLYVELQGAAAQAGDRTVLAVPERRLLDEAAVLAAPELFKRMTATHGLELDSVLFEVETQTGQRRLHVVLPIRGSYRRLGGLLDEIVRLAALEALVRIAASHEGEQDVMRLELKLGLE